MDLKEMTIEQLEERKAEIIVSLDNSEAELDLDALEQEVRSIKEELETRKAEEAKKSEEAGKAGQAEDGEKTEKSGGADTSGTAAEKQDTED